MAKGFTEKEKTLIRERLISAGCKHFERFGVRKTSVADLAGEAGIAKGSFYLFFESKEDLFLAIHEKYETELRRDAPWCPKLGEQPKDTIRRFLHSVFSLFSSDPMLKLFLDKEEFASLAIKMPSERFKRHQESNNEFLIQIIEEWQRQGILTNQIEPAVIAGAIVSLFFALLNKDMIGTDIFPKVAEVLVDALTEKLA